MREFLNINCNKGMGATIINSGRQDWHNSIRWDYSTIQKSPRTVP